jgi:hypothetical protein
MAVHSEHDAAMHPVAVWVVGAAALVCVAAIVMFGRRRVEPPDLGSVSDQWIAEQRAHKTPDAHR